MKLLFIILIIFSSCQPQECYNTNRFLNITDYKINIARYTKLGIGLDDPHFLLNEGEVDDLVAGLKECLQEKGIQVDFKPECISVKVPSDIYRSECTDKLLFPCNINPQICINKGLEVSEECPCNCRSIIQDTTIITTPELENFKGELARLITGINNPWIKMGECL